MPLINVTTNNKDINAGEVKSNPPPVGNYLLGSRVFLSGTEVVIPTGSFPIDWETFESVTVSTTAVALTATTYLDRTEAMITTETAALRYRVDGGNPTASVGHTIEAGGTLTLTGTYEISKFRAIRRDGADATIRVSYGRRRSDAVI